MPHDTLFEFIIFLFCFCVISRQTVILINYSFLCFTAWLVNINISGAEVFNMLVASKSYNFDQHYQPGKKISQVSILMIEY